MLPQYFDPARAVSNGTYKIAAILVIATFVVGVVLTFSPHPLLKRASGSVEFQIEKGQSLGATARLLAERNAISSRYLFIAYAVVAGHEKDFKAGKYLLPAGASIAKLVNIFARGLSESDDIIVTITEGSNVGDIARMLSKIGLIEEKTFLDPETLKLEGYLFPDTYRFSKVSTGDRKWEVLEKFQENFGNKTNPVLRGLSEPKKREAIIIASILEKEVKTEQDMRLVAGIIEKRLSLGMPLELDATLAYGSCYLRFLLGEYCNVSLANIVDNISVDSAYNTYKRRGLPTGPISNPGLKAIVAALHPQASDFLYYLSAKDGTTIFSKTATEHLRARQKYLQINPKH